MFSPTITLDLGTSKRHLGICNDTICIVRNKLRRRPGVCTAVKCHISRETRFLFVHSTIFTVKFRFRNHSVWIRFYLIMQTTFVRLAFFFATTKYRLLSRRTDGDAFARNTLSEFFTADWPRCGRASGISYCKQVGKNTLWGRASSIHGFYA